MEAFPILLQRFVSGAISVDAFETEFLDLWRETWDESDMPIEIKQSRAKLMKAQLAGDIPADEFEREYQAIDAKFWLERGLDPYSIETQIIADLGLEVDAYSNEPPYNVSADELREAARKALTELLALQKERN